MHPRFLALPKSCLAGTSHPQGGAAALGGTRSPLCQGEEGRSAEALQAGFPCHAAPPGLCRAPGGPGVDLDAGRGPVHARHIPPGPLCAAQTCLPGFFHTKPVSQGISQSDELGVPTPPSGAPTVLSHRRGCPAHAGPGMEPRTPQLSAVASGMSWEAGGIRTTGRVGLPPCPTTPTPPGGPAQASPVLSVGPPLCL